MGLFCCVLLLFFFFFFVLLFFCSEYVGFALVWIKKRKKQNRSEVMALSPRSSLDFVQTFQTTANYIRHCSLKGGK